VRRSAAVAADGPGDRRAVGPSDAWHDEATVDAGEVAHFSDDIAIGPFTGGESGGRVQVTVANTADLPATYTATIAATSPDGSVR
jgi:hypothetical protein